MRLWFYALLIVIHFALLAGCSGTTKSPTEPANTGENILVSSLPIGISDVFSDGSPAGGMGTLGLFQLTIDPSDASAELVSLRENMSTDTLEVVDITNFLQLAPCSDCAKIGNVSLDADNHIVVNVGIKHPFDAGDPLKPITGRNRADLHVFNVEGIIVSSGTGDSYASLGQTLPGFSLVNCDGFTGYLDPVLDDIFPTDATVHPYITHFDDYSQGNYDPVNPTGFESVTDPPPSGNLVMAMGCDYDYQDYIFAIDESEPVDFIFAVGCTYAVSADTKLMRFTPEYRIPQHNKKAASEVSFHIITNDLKGEDITTTAEVEVHVVDINHGVPVGDGLGDMFADSSVGSIIIELPGVMTDTFQIDGSSPVSGTGHDPSDPLIYAATITNTAGGVEGTYSGLVKVVDTYTPGLNTSVLLNGMDGIERVDPIANPLEGLFEINEFATYQTFSIDVATAYVPQITLIYDDTWDPDLPQNTYGNDIDDSDERGPCIDWEPDGEYCINFAVQFWPFDEPWGGSRTVAFLFSDDLQTISEFNTPWYGGVGWDAWNKSYMSDRIDATYVTYHEVDGLQHPLALADHSFQAAWGGGWAWMDHSDEIFVSQVTGKCFFLGDHDQNIRYGISNAVDSLPFSLYSDCYHSNIGPGYLSECQSMEDDSTGRIYLVHFDGSPMTEIRMARSTDLEIGHSWDINPVFNGGSGYSEVRDPGLDIYTDDSIHISFSRLNNTSGNYEMVYLSSDDGGETYSDPMVVDESPDPIYDNPVMVFEDPSLPGYEFIIIVYETGDQIYIVWSADGGATWTDTPEQVSSDSFTNHDPDFDIDDTNSTIHVIYVEDDPVTYGDMMISNYHFELI